MTLHRRWFLLSMGAPLLARAQARLPARNLLVEWRAVDAARDERSGGAVVLRSDGSGTRAGVVVESRSADRRSDAVQRVAVLNGRSATVHVSQSVPWQFVQDAGKHGVAIGTVWIESGRSLQVQPSWPGGNAPVTVELQADVAGTAGAGDSQREQVRTTLQLPLNQWAVVAESGDQRRVLQLRVSAAD